MQREKNQMGVEGGERVEREREQKGERVERERVDKERVCRDVCLRERERERESATKCPLMYR